ncbi:MAG: hypothetical protein ACKVOJ_08370 [Sphingomonadaceae bacterium]
MSAIDWTVPAKLLARDDAGSEMFYEFRDVGSGSLAALVAKVMAMDAQDRARVVIDAGAVGTFNIGQIVELAARGDFPPQG